MTLRNLALLIVSVLFLVLIIGSIIAKKLKWFVLSSLVFIVISAIYAGLCVFTNTDMVYRRYYALEFWVIFIALVIVGLLYIQLPK